MKNRPSTFEFLTVIGFGIALIAGLVFVGWLVFGAWLVIDLINWTSLLSAITPLAPFSIAILCVVILFVSAFLGAVDSAFSEAESEGDSTSFE